MLDTSKNRNPALVCLALCDFKCQSESKSSMIRLIISLRKSLTIEIVDYSARPSSRDQTER
mgnify:CR=1 FL=1